MMNWTTAWTYTDNHQNYIQIQHKNNKNCLSDKSFRGMRKLLRIIGRTHLELNLIYAK